MLVLLLVWLLLLLLLLILLPEGAAEHLDVGQHLGARQRARGLGALRVVLEGDLFVFKHTHVLFGWAFFIRCDLWLLFMTNHYTRRRPLGGRAQSSGGNNIQQHNTHITNQFETLLIIMITIHTYQNHTCVTSGRPRAIGWRRQN